MGQSEVYEVLENSNEPMCASEIAQVLNQSPGSIQLSLNRMFKYNEVNFINKKVKVNNSHKEVRHYYIVYNSPVIRNI